MSERMIEIQRARLGLAPAGPSPSTPVQSTARSPGKGNLQKPQPGAAAIPQTPQQVAATQILSEDAQIQRFIHRLQRRDDSHPMSDTSNGPTVPTALSRRMLQRQGVGYLDDTVASAISASADRFLATILQQAVACRDQRLKGAEMSRSAARHRKRHIQHYEADMDDRKRRRDELEEAREKDFLKTIGAAEALKKGGASSKDSDDKKKKKKKKVDIENLPTNGAKAGSAAKDLEADDDESYDSIDEEEDYYHEKLGDVRPPLKGDEEEDEDTLLLKDLSRPLEAWDFHLTGKEALEEQNLESGDEEGDDDDEEKPENTAPMTEEEGNDEGLTLAGMDGPKGDGKAGNDSENEATLKAVLSPAPKASSQ